MVFAQTFEVASVKPNKSGTSAVSFRLQPDWRFNALNVTVHSISIRFAHAVQPFQIEGGPSWLDVGRFDVIAKVEGTFRPCPRDSWGPCN